MELNIKLKSDTLFTLFLEPISISLVLSLLTADAANGSSFIFPFQVT
jgi:hypothetical protein